jgi:hypothetical protein
MGLGAMLQHAAIVESDMLFSESLPNVISGHTSIAQPTFLKKQVMAVALVMGE